MSKKCCGIIYSDNEKFCTMCGKSLKELPDVEAQAEEIPVKKTEDEQPIEEAGSKVDSEKISEEKEKLDVLDMAEVDRIAASVSENKINENVDESTAQSESKEANNIDSPAVAPEEKKELTAKAEKKTEVEEEKQEEEEEDDDDDDDGTASPGLKFFGTLIILLMLASIVAVGLGVYFIMLNPFYKNYDINNPVVYEEMSTNTDVTNIVTRPALTEVSIEPETATDASQEENDTDATETDATDTDASGEME